MLRSTDDQIKERLARLREDQLKERLARLREDHSVDDNHTSEGIDVLGRPVSLNSEIDREANQRFGREANSLFGEQAKRVYAPYINDAKRAAAKKQVDNIRVYSDFLSLGAGALMACVSSNFASLPVSFAIGAMSAITAHFVLPQAFDKLEDVMASEAEAHIKVKVRAVW